MDSENALKFSLRLFDDRIYQGQSPVLPGCISETLQRYDISHRADQYMRPYIHHRRVISGNYGKGETTFLFFALQKHRNFEARKAS